MATINPFDLLGDDDNDDPSHLIAVQQQKLAAAPKKAPAQAGGAAQTAKPAKLPSKPLPPAQAVREARSDAPRGGGRGSVRGFGRGRGREGGFNREFRDNQNDENTFNDTSNSSRVYKPLEDGEGKTSERRTYGAPRGGYRGGRRGGFNNGEFAEGERPRRIYERHSGTGRGVGPKREGAGRGNWGTPSDEIAPETEELTIENERSVDPEKQTGQEDAGDAIKENPVDEPEEKEPEDKEMTLEEYEKVLEEKRKALQELKTEERKVVLDKDLQSMQVLSCKKTDEEIFAKLGTDKEKRKEAAEKEEKAKKSVTINEFLKPADGGRYSSGGGRGRGRGRGPRGGGFSGGYNPAPAPAAPSINDVGEFPSLGGK